ncbi:MAG: hypothetical protein R3C09_24020 [Pirellulaceae bacterium]
MQNEHESERRIADLLDEAKQLCNIIGKSIVTAKENLPKPKRDPPPPPTPESTS